LGFVLFGLDVKPSSFVLISTFLNYSTLVFQMPKQTQSPVR